MKPWQKPVLFRCSSLGKLMTEPKSKSEGILSVGAKTYIRELAAQEIFGVDFVVSSKAMEKGIQCEQASIDLLNSVRCLSLVKNTERKSNGLITGEADLIGVDRGHDIKTSWSIQTFPLLESDCVDKGYEWQMRGYMQLWDVNKWEVNYCLVDTPEHLIGYESPALHTVSHIPEHMRVTTWTIERDADKEALIAEKVAAAREYFKQVISEFDRSHAV